MTEEKFVNLIDPVRRAKFEQLKQENHGFLTEEGVATLATVARLHPVLVRCGSGRFTCAAQDAAHFIEAIEKSGMDYVRDVSFIAER